jgi:hypothetical protein
MIAPRPTGIGEGRGADQTTEGSASLAPGWHRPRFLAPRTARRPRDRQRKKAYRFERDNLRAVWPLWLDSIPTEQAFPQAVNLVWGAERTRYGLGDTAAPPVVISPRRRRACYWPGVERIVFASKSHFGSVLHEVAHALTTGSIARHEREPHGPEFVGVLIGLYVRHGVCIRDAGTEYQAQDCARDLAQKARVGYDLRVDERWIEGKP